MEVFVRAGINLCDLIIFWYYLKSFRKKKKIPKKWCELLIGALAVVWAWISTLGYPFFNFFALILSLGIITCLFEGDNHSNIVITVIYIIVGMLLGLSGLIFYFIINFHLNSITQIMYYFIAGFGVLIRGIVVYCVCKKQLLKKIHLFKIPKEIVCILIFIFGLLVLNCYLLHYH